MLKGHFEGKSDGLLQRVVTINEEIQKESYHKTILKKHFDTRETELKEYICTGKGEIEIENALFLSDNAWIKHYRGEILFVKGLECPRLLKRLIGTPSSDRCRILIIHVPDRNIVPKDIIDPFEWVNLEPEKELQAIEQDRPETASKPPAQAENVFRWCNGTWQIKFDGSTIHPPDRKGLRYIHHLLANPSKEISTSELIKVIPDTQGKRLLRKRGEGVLVEDGLNEPTSDNSIDEMALKQYRERLVEIDAAIKDAEDVERN